MTEWTSYRTMDFASLCLVKGHLCKECKKKMTSDVCALKRPSLLHFSKEKDTQEKQVGTEINSSTDRTSRAIRRERDYSACTGAGDSCVLAIVPLGVKASKGDKTVEVCAFMDLSSSVSFCKAALARQLNVQCRCTELMWSTINSKGKVEGYVFTDLEVSGLEDNNFIALSKVYTQKSIPVSSENIPLQRD